MLTRPAYKVDAFTLDPLRGNPAGVFPLARGLTEEQMLAVAREMGLPETAFVLPSREADLRLRFFTPAQEVPLCGHGLVAALVLLCELGEIHVGRESSRVRVETGAGVLAADLVRVHGAVRVDAAQAPPAFLPFRRSPARVLAILGASAQDVCADLPLELWYTGLWHLLVPLGSAEALDGLMPDCRALASLNREVGALGTYAFVEEAEGFRCRCFAPAAGIDEDPVTGTAAGALGAYLLHHGIARRDEPFAVLQGDACGRPGRVRVVASGGPGRAVSVTVGGHAVVSLRGEMRVAGHA